MVVLHVDRLQDQMLELGAFGSQSSEGLVITPSPQPMHLGVPGAPLHAAGSPAHVLLVMLLSSRYELLLHT